MREGFRRKEFRGKLAIAITANFKNRNTTAEAKVEEISGVAFIFNQRFFQDLRQDTGMKTSSRTTLRSSITWDVCPPGIDLENIVYYKDDTHYFVMTAKKQNLLEKGVILQVGPSSGPLVYHRWVPPAVDQRSTGDHHTASSAPPGLRGH